MCQKCSAATGRLAWRERASAAKLSAEHAEEKVAPGGPAAQFVDMGLSVALNACYTIEVAPFDDTFSALRGRLLDPVWL